MQLAVTIREISTGPLTYRARLTDEYVVDGKPTFALFDKENHIIPLDSVIVVEAPMDSRVKVVLRRAQSYGVRLSETVLARLVQS